MSSFLKTQINRPCSI